MKAIIRFWAGHGTKALGTIVTIIPGLLGIDGLIQKEHVKYWLAAGVVFGALTVGRGFTNSKEATK